MNRYVAIICIPLLLIIGLTTGCVENRGKEVYEVTFDQYGGKYGHGGAYNSQIIPMEVVLLQWSPPTQQ